MYTHTYIHFLTQTAVTAAGPPAEPRTHRASGSLA